MKIEARGKYAGVKVHLDGDEAALFLEVVAGKKLHAQEEAQVIEFATKLGHKIQKLVKEVPNLLVDRTEAQIKEALEGDAEKITKQLAALKHGGDQWKHVK